MLCEADLLCMNSVLIILAKLSEAYGLLYYVNSVLIVLCQISSMKFQWHFPLSSLLREVRCAEADLGGA